VSPSGRTVYATCRKHDRCVVITSDTEKRHIRDVPKGGKRPRPIRQATIRWLLAAAPGLAALLWLFLEAFR
jgi:hypothetical protein